MNAIFLFLAGCAFAQLFLTHAAGQSATLNEKLTQYKIELIKIHIQERSPVQEKSYEVRWNRSWRGSVTNEHQPFTINIFDEIYLLNDNRVMTVDDTFSNGTPTFREIGRIRQYRVVKFVRSIVWNGTTYILLCYELHSCSLHTMMQNNALRFRHTIRHRGIPVDAKFFTQGSRLYLIIANNADKFPVPSVIYRWSGTYMDVVGEVMAIGARSVVAFEHRQSTIIVFSQYDAKDPRIGSQVYEFRGKDIVRTQFIFATRPTSVHHYVHGDINFILMINELEPSSLLCWEGRELLDWSSLPEVGPDSLISIFHLDGDTFIIVARNNIIQLYKFHSTSDLKNENTKRFKDDQKIVDMAVSLNAYRITVTLVMKETDVYWVERWEAEVTAAPIESTAEDADSTMECLKELIEVLQRRMPGVKKAQDSWRFLLPSAEDLTMSETVSFDDMILQAGTVDRIEVVTDKTEDILPPHEVEETLNRLDEDVMSVQSMQQKMMDEHVSRVLNGDIEFDDVFVDELDIDRMNVDFVNGEKVEEAILPEGEQEFANSLRADSVFVRDLEVDSLCGIPSRYWALRSNTTNIITADNGPVEYTNDTVTVNSDTTIENLIVNSLNGTVIGRLIDDLFIVNDRQKIKGRITFNKLTVENLTARTLNGVPAERLMTIPTNQSFDSFFAKYLQIDHLQAETVNEVPVEQAARKSRENIIRGTVNIARLHVTENFTVDMNASWIQSPENRPLQIYSNVTIQADLHLQNIKVDSSTALFVADAPVNVSDMFNGLWTKSSDQTITKEVTLENGLRIDELGTKYLNGFVESDFLYTTMEEIPKEFSNLHFKSFHVSDSFLQDGDNATFFEVQSDVLLINQALHLRRVQAQNVITLNFNGMNIDSIMNGSVANFTGTKEFPAIRARRVLVGNMTLGFLNDREVRFEEGLHVDDDHQLATLKASEFHVRSLEVDSLNGAGIGLLMRLKDLKSSDLRRIVVVGDLTVRNLTVDQIGNQTTGDFLEILSQNDVVINSNRNIENLVARNVTLRSLRGQNFDDLADSVLTRSTTQRVPGCLSARSITSDNITVDFFNKMTSSQLIWVDQPLTIIGNVTFTDLDVEGDVITSSLNEQQASELHDSLLLVPVQNINLLKVDGNVSWDEPVYSPASISYLLEKAVTKDEDQIITGDVIFQKNVHAWAVTGPFNVTEEIRDIIVDAVMDDGEPVDIGGNKAFQGDFTADSLKVNGDLGVREVNRVNINEFKDSIVRKYHDVAIAGPLVFAKDVKVEKLLVKSPDLNASFNMAVRSADILPGNVFFEDLVVLGDVSLTDLDGVNFNKFVDKRVTLSGNHDVWCNVRFNKPLTVTDKVDLKRINGILSSDFVLNNANEAQIISGVKTFEQNLTVQGNVTATRVNDRNITAEYGQGVFNYKDVYIPGNLVFKADVRLQEMNTSGLVNGVDVRSVVDDLHEMTNEILWNVKKSKQSIARNVAYGSKMLKALRNVFFYLEVEKDLMISAFNVTNVEALRLEEATRLNVNVEHPGSCYDLPEDCPCVDQLVIELSDETKIQSRKPGEVVKSLYGPDGVVVDVVIDVVSSGKLCSLTRTGEEELITVSLEKSENNSTRRIVLPVDALDEIATGLRRDAEIFRQNGDTYIILAVYYNKAEETHRASSLLYKVDAAGEEVKLIQRIPTSGAWSIEILQIGQNEVFLLIGCLGESSRSLLYGFDPAVQQFKLIRTFASRSRHVKSLSQGEHHFVLLDNPDLNAVDIYEYDAVSKSFRSYQSIIHDRRVSGIELFYIGDHGNSDAFVIVTTEGGRFYIYEYMFAVQFQVRLQHAVNGLRTMTPFYYRKHQYIFAGTYGNSTIFRIVQQGPH